MTENVPLEVPCSPIFVAELLQVCWIVVMVILLRCHTTNYVATVMHAVARVLLRKLLRLDQLPRGPS